MEKREWDIPQGGIIVLTGGAFQGQEEYAKAHYPGSRIFPELSEWFRALLQEGKEPEEVLKEELFSSGGFTGSSPAVVIAYDIGCGIVPLDPFERSLRERYGRFTTALAERAERVERIFCGLSERLK